MLQTFVRIVLSVIATNVHKHGCHTSVNVWYKDAETGLAVPIILTEEGERVVRIRLGLPCPVPGEIPAVHAEAAVVETTFSDTMPLFTGTPPCALEGRGDLLTPKESLELQLSPTTKKTLLAAFCTEEPPPSFSMSSSAAPSAAQPISLSANAADKLFDALYKARAAKRQRCKHQDPFLICVIALHTTLQTQVE